MLLDTAMTELISVKATKTGTCEIPGTVTKLDNYAFYDCTELSEIIVPASVTRIKSSCFHNTDGLKRLIIKKPEGSIDGAPWDAKIFPTWNN